MPLVEARGILPPPEAIGAAAAVLAAGGVVGLPTDTVYGLAVDPRAAGAVEAVFTLKGRPDVYPLPVLVAGTEQGAQLADLTGPARLLADRFWPGGLTIVVPRRAGIDLDLGGDPATVGLRCPEHPVALTLCRRVGPLAATSANRHGEPPLASADEVVEAFPGLFVLDGGDCRGVASTVVDATGAQEDAVSLLRAGAVPWEDIAAVLGRPG
jgi:L-threonylcarbamoyladenylate synthase